MGLARPHGKTIIWLNTKIGGSQLLRGHDWIDFEKNDVTALKIAMLISEFVKETEKSMQLGQNTFAK